MLGQIRAQAQRTGLRVRVIRRDLTRRCGPLGGVFTALKTTRAEAVLFLACDMPFVTAGLIERLVAQSVGRASRHSGDVDPVFVRAKREVGFPFVLPQKALQVVEGQIQQGQLSLQALAKALKARLIRLLPAWQPQLRNVNTPQEWEKTRKVWAEDWSSLVKWPQFC
jgi:molybdopterin-guanine dinucleotide biosynthesis protein A